MRLVILSANCSHSVMLRHLDERGTLGYLNGSVPRANWEMSLISSFKGCIYPSQINCRLSVLARSPEVLEKTLMHSQITLTEERPPLQKIIKSSAKQRCMRLMDLHRGWKPKVPTMLFKLLDKYSIPITNNKGETGSPCRNPHFAAKMLVGDPLIIKA